MKATVVPKCHNLPWYLLINALLATIYILKKQQPTQNPNTVMEPFRILLK